MTITNTVEVSGPLIHFGKKGMRWGVRKETSSSSGGDTARKKSAHRVRLEAGYIRNGKSLKESEAMAAKRIKTEKILGVVGGVAVLGLAAYAGKVAYGKAFTDVVLESGQEFKNINRFGDNAILDRRLYTTFKDGDTQKYRGLLAATLRRQVDGAKIYETTLRAKETIKAPSQFEAAKLYGEFLKKTGNSSSKLGNYLTFNRNLVYENPTNARFYEFMKSKGYNSLLDANDQFFSGYAAKKPLIIFNANSSTSLVGHQVVNKQLTDRLQKIQLTGVLSKRMASTVGLGVAATSIKRGLDTRSRYSTVNDYMMKNPNTKLSYSEIFAKTRMSITGKYVIDP